MPFDDQERLEADKLLEMTEKQFENWVDEGNHSDFDVVVLWKKAKELQANQIPGTKPHCGSKDYCRYKCSVCGFGCEKPGELCEEWVCEPENEE